MTAIAEALENVRKTVTCDYKISDIILAEELSKINTSYINRYIDGSSDLDPNELKIIWNYSMYNMRPYCKFKCSTPKLIEINELLISAGFDQTQAEHLTEVFKKQPMISPGNLNEFIPLYVALKHPIIYTHAYDTPRMKDVQISKRITNMIAELTYIKEHTAEFVGAFEYMSSLQYNLHIGDFIPNRPLYDQTVKYRVPLRYSIDESDKHYICNVHFVTNADYERLTKNNEWIKNECAQLHLYTLGEDINNPDEAKLITLFPLQNKVIKFHHDPSISQLPKLRNHSGHPIVTPSDVLAIPVDA